MTIGVGKSKLTRNDPSPRLTPVALFTSATRALPTIGSGGSRSPKGRRRVIDCCSTDAAAAEPLKCNQLRSGYSISPHPSLAGRSPRFSPGSSDLGAAASAGSLARLYPSKSTDSISRPGADAECPADDRHSFLLLAISSARETCADAGAIDGHGTGFLGEPFVPALTSVLRNVLGTEAGVVGRASSRTGHHPPFWLASKPNDCPFLGCVEASFGVLIALKELVLSRLGDRGRRPARR